MDGSLLLFHCDAALLIVTAAFAAFWDNRKSVKFFIISLFNFSLISKRTSFILAILGIPGHFVRGYFHFELQLAFMQISELIIVKRKQLSRCEN